LLGEVNDRLDKYPRSRIFYEKPLTARDAQFSIRSMPRNLLGALWVQIAEVLSGWYLPKKCPGPGCPKWIEISRDEKIGRTKRSAFCSDVCRVLTHRLRVTRAKEMRAAGKTLREIAAELDTDRKFVKRWTTLKRRASK